MTHGEWRASCRGTVAAIESSPVISSRAGLCRQTLPGRSRGVLWRDRMARYTPGANDPLGQANLALAPIVLSGPPRRGPYAGNCGSATSRASSKRLPKVTLPPDILSAYIDRGLPWDSSQMNPNDPETSAIPCRPQTQPCQPFPSLSDFSLIQAQLSNEFEWVTQVWTFIGALQAPFGTASGDLGPVVGSVADTIRNSLNTPSTAQHHDGLAGHLRWGDCHCGRGHGRPGSLARWRPRARSGILLIAQQSEGASNWRRQSAGANPGRGQSARDPTASSIQRTLRRAG
jgi:hypothetical protein